jgi:dUTP pyrophosphatase
MSDTDKLYPGELTLKVKLNKPTAKVPFYGTPGSACFDLSACVDSAGLVLFQGHSAVIDTGLSVEVPPGYVLQMFVRSSMGVKGTRLGNGTGIIDSDYRGPLMVSLHQWGVGSVTIRDGERIAQAMLVKIPAVNIMVVDELSETERGQGGFGSTGS